MIRVQKQEKKKKKNPINTKKIERIKKNLGIKLNQCKWKLFSSSVKILLRMHFHVLWLVFILEICSLGVYTLSVSHKSTYFFCRKIHVDFYCNSLSKIALLQLNFFCLSAYQKYGINDGHDVLQLTTLLIMN